MDTTSPADPFEYPIELIWGRMPELFLTEPVKSEIENALYRIFWGRGFFYVHWAPLRAFQLSFGLKGEFEVEEPKISRTQELAHTGAAIMAASTVIERCLDLAGQIARVYLGDALRSRQDVQPIEGIKKSRLVLGRLAGDPELEDKLRGVLGDRPLGLAVTAVGEASKQLIMDPFPLIDLGDGVVPTEREATLLRHMWAHARDQDFTLVSRGTFGQFAQAMSHYYNLTAWLLLANSLGGACREWSTVARL